MAQRFVTYVADKWQHLQALVTSVGEADAGKIIATNSNGILDDTVINASTTGGLPNANKIIKAKADGTLDVTFLPSGVGVETEVIPASEALSAGNAINKWIDTGVLKVRKADANGKPADGFVKASVSSGADATVYITGANDAVTGLTPGRIFLSATAGAYSSTPPAEGSGLIHQELGFANSATFLQFKAGIPITLAS